MISSIRVRNYRSVADSGDLPLGPVTLLIGPNNTGKSTLLRSLYLMQQGSPFEIDDIRLRTDAAVITYDLTPRSALAQQVHPDPDVHGRTDLKAEVTVSRGEPQPKFQSTWENGQAANSRPQLPTVWPENIIAPVFARRRADGYDTTVRQDLAQQVGVSDRYLSSRIAALTGDHAEAARFRDGLERVVGLGIGNHLTGQGQLPGRSLSANEHIALSRMGDGVAAVLTIVSELATGKPKVFLVEEPETDLHPAALRNLLDMMVEAVAAGNQFVVSTHNDLVVRHLGSVDGATVYRTSQTDDDGLPTTTFHPVGDAFARVEALRDLGYDARIPPAWLVFEESSAEQVVRDAVIPLLQPQLGAVATVSARGAGNLKVTVQDLTRLVLFVHLQGADAVNRAWVLADDDKAGTDGLAAVAATYPNLRPDHLVALHPDGFEAYYPPRFDADVAAIVAEPDRRRRKEAKGKLAAAVVAWALNNPDEAREELRASAAPLLKVLGHIEAELATS